jgi:hypothetical protein
MTGVVTHACCGTHPTHRRHSRQGAKYKRRFVEVTADTLLYAESQQHVHTGRIRVFAVADLVAVRAEGELKFQVSGCVLQRCRMLRLPASSSRTTSPHSQLPATGQVPRAQPAVQGGVRRKRRARRVGGRYQGRQAAAERS